MAMNQIDTSFYARCIDTLEKGCVDLMDKETCERWLGYRDNRNNTAHDFGVGFTEETVILLTKFVEGARSLSAIISTP